MHAHRELTHKAVGAGARLVHAVVAVDAYVGDAAFHATEAALLVAAAAGAGANQTVSHALRRIVEGQQVGRRVAANAGPAHQGDRGGLRGALAAAKDWPADDKAAVVAPPHPRGSWQQGKTIQHRQLGSRREGQSL